MITYDMVGHVAYGAEPCVTAAADSYLISGRLPSTDLTCARTG
jgi:hypothetical protein